MYDAVQAHFASNGEKTQAQKNAQIEVSKVTQPAFFFQNKQCSIVNKVGIKMLFYCELWVCIQLGIILCQVLFHTRYMLLDLLEAWVGAYSSSREIFIVEILFKILQRTLLWIKSKLANNQVLATKRLQYSVAMNISRISLGSTSHNKAAFLISFPGIRNATDSELRGFRPGYLFTVYFVQHWCCINIYITF